MNKKLISIYNLFLIFIIIFSFYINYYYANIGVFHIDTFAFFDTGYNILLDRHPFRDIWVTTGPLVDYLQSVFFRVFGLNWNSYVIHGSVFNSIISVYLFVILNKFKLNKYLSFFYSVTFAVLCYPVSGTPFAYMHSYVLSILSILIFFYSIKFNSKVSFFLLPLVMCSSFFSMQNPSTYINLILVISIFFYIFLFKRVQILKFFLYGCAITFFMTFLFLKLNKIPIENIIQQYFLFPLSMAENRISGNEMAHITLTERFTFRNVIGHFKFINLYIIFFIITTFLEIRNNKILKEDLLINLVLVFSAISLIFNQLITSNQTYIFSLIPLLGGFFHIYLNKKFPNLKKSQFFLVLLILFTTIKYHNEYNVKRKFMDLQNVNLKNYVEGSLLHNKFKNLKWISPGYSENPQEELALLKDTIKRVQEIETKKMVMTHHQFFSLVLEENLYIPNRWYTHDNNSYPLKNHKYFEFYKNHFQRNLNKNQIKTIITIGDPKFSNYKIYLENYCFTKTKINKITNIYNLKKSCD